MNSGNPIGSHKTSFVGEPVRARAILGRPSTFPENRSSGTSAASILVDSLERVCFIFEAAGQHRKILVFDENRFEIQQAAILDARIGACAISRSKQVG